MRLKKYRWNICEMSIVLQQKTNQTVLKINCNMLLPTCAYNEQEP